MRVRLHIRGGFLALGFRGEGGGAHILRRRCLWRAYIWNKATQSPTELQKLQKSYGWSPIRPLDGSYRPKRGRVLNHPDSHSLHSCRGRRSASCQRATSAQPKQKFRVRAPTSSRALGDFEGIRRADATYNQVLQTALLNVNAYPIHILPVRDPPSTLLGIDT